MRLQVWESRRIGVRGALRLCTKLLQSNSAASTFRNFPVLYCDSVLYHAMRPCHASTQGLAHSEHVGGTTWTYDFAGLDWEGVDAAGAAWECLHETSQSPVNVAGVEGMCGKERGFMSMAHQGGLWP